VCVCVLAEGTAKVDDSAQYQRARREDYLLLDNSASHSITSIRQSD